MSEETTISITLDDRDVMAEGGPAFPIAFQHNRTGGSIVYQEWQGMSLRDYFAAAALTGFAQHQGWIGYMNDPEHRTHLLENYARDAFAFADAMLKARE